MPTTTITKVKIRITFLDIILKFGENFETKSKYINFKIENK